MGNAILAMQKSMAPYFLPVLLCFSSIDEREKLLAHGLRKAVSMRASSVISSLRRHAHLIFARGTVRYTMLLLAITTAVARVKIRFLMFFSMRNTPGMVDNGCDSRLNRPAEYRSSTTSTLRITKKRLLIQVIICLDAMRRNFETGGESESEDRISGDIVAAASLRIEEQHGDVPPAPAEVDAVAEEASSPEAVNLDPRRLREEIHSLQTAMR